MTTPTPTPTYDPRVPQPKDNLAQSQVDFLNNFTVLYNAFGLNHVALDAASNAGNHNVIQLSEQTADPLTNVSEVSVYVKNAPGQTDQVFLEYPNGTGFQFSCYQIYSLQVLAWQTSYFTFLPGRVIVYFGSINPPASPGGNTLYFPPYVMKNLISINFCPLGVTATGTPWIELQQDRPGFFTSARLFGIGISVYTPQAYYIAMGNI